MTNNSINNNDTDDNNNDDDKPTTIINKKKILEERSSDNSISCEWFHRLETMTKENKKNKKVKLVDGVIIHNYWDNIFRRKAKMHSWFSESAFGSDSDKLTEYRNIWEDPEYQKKYAKKKEKEDNNT